MKSFSFLLLLLLTCGVASAQTEVKADTTSTSKELDELVVEVKKQTVKAQGDRISYDMQQDKTSRGSTLIDALRKVPLVTVDGEGKITVNGSSNFQIYVNGKPNPMLTANYSTVFKGMPAEAVSKIEVITEPGAKYDAEGLGGILNLIISQQQKTDGYAGSVSSSISQQNWMGYVYGSMKKGKVSADGTMVYLQSAWNPQSSYSESETVDNVTGARQFQTSFQKFGLSYLAPTFNLSWEPTAKDLITAGGNLIKLDASTREMNAATYSYIKGYSKPLTSVSQNMKAEFNNMSVSANASYQHSFEKKGHNIILSYLYNFGDNPLNLYSENREERDEMINGHSAILPRPATASLTTNITRDHTAQLDYTLPLVGDAHLLEAGAKVISRLNSNYSSNMMGSSFESLATIAGSEQKMDQHQNIYALYGSYMATWGNWNGKAGLRYEYTDMGTVSLLKPTDKYSSRFQDFVPNAALTYSFTQASNLRFGYQMRIARPTLAQLSPFRQQIIENVVNVGNPDLVSEKNNNLDLTYSNFTAWGGGRIGLGYSYTGNAITQVAISEGDTFLNTTLNVGNRQVFKSNLLGMLNLGAILNVQVSGEVNYSIFNGGEYSNRGWGGNYNVSFSYTAPYDIRVSGYGGQTIHPISLQGYGTGYYYYGVGVNRDFLRNKSLNISLSAQNFLSDGISFHQYYTTGSKSISSYSNTTSRDFKATITWKFGNLNSQRRTTNAKIVNDDTVKTSGGVGTVSM